LLRGVDPYGTGGTRPPCPIGIDAPEQQHNIGSRQGLVLLSVWIRIGLGLGLGSGHG